EGWLLRVAHTTFLQELRKRSRRREQSLEASERAVADALAQRGASCGDEWPDLERLLRALAPEIRSMMILVYGMGYTLGEVADIVDMPVGTVKSHLSRAKARLRNDFDLQGAA
ncbi:MAG: RNA polymerase sigma factor, partial [Pseudomonadota bacterium]